MTPAEQERQKRPVYGSVFDYSKKDAGTVHRWPAPMAFVLHIRGFRVVRLTGEERQRDR